MKLYASELMELARKEPEKYEGKRYKVLGLYCIGPESQFYGEVIVGSGGKLQGKGYDNWSYINSNTELEEIPQSVPFMEAVKAYSEGKKIRCEVVLSTTNQVYKYEPFGNGIGLHGYKLSTYKGSGTPVTTKEILEGKWFIEE